MEKWGKHAREMLAGHGLMFHCSDIFPKNIYGISIIYQDLKKKYCQLHGPSVADLFPKKTNLNNFVFSPRLDKFCPGDWGERLTCSPTLNVLCPGAVQLRLDLLISECRNHSRNQEFHGKKRETSIPLFQLCIKYLIFACT